MTDVFLGLGANIGNREANLRLALRWLEGPCHVVTVSSLYRSQAVVPEGQPPGPDFLNAACRIETDLDPVGLLRFVKEIEHAIGRRPASRWAPRPIDVDILLFADKVIDNDDLVIPHPLVAQRNFVLLPLAEIAPDVEHPLLRRRFAELAEDADLAGLQHVMDPEWARAAPGERLEPEDHGDESVPATRAAR